MSLSRQLFLRIAGLAACAFALGMALPACSGASTPAQASAASKVAVSANSKTAAWDDVVAAAKQEGKLVLVGPQGNDVRDALTQGFQKRYPGITIDFSGMAGAEIAPKVLAERSANRVTTDMVITGTTTILTTFKPAKAIVPLTPYLVGPDIRDAKWRGGKVSYADDQGDYDLVFAVRVQIPFIYSQNAFNPGLVKSYKDLLKPEWKEKIAMLDPRRAGGSLDIMTFAYSQPSLGKEFLHDLFAQNVAIYNDSIQIIDAVGKGSRLIGIGPDGASAIETKNKGVPIDIFPGDGLQEGGFLSASNGTVAVFENAPHPNAVKTYLNYLLSQEQQLVWSKASGQASLRADVARDHLPDSIVPKDGVSYQENFREQYQVKREEVVNYLKTVMPA